MCPEPPLAWSGWFPLEGCWRGTAVPRQPGLYRLRRVGRDDLAYIGQTGGSLRQRLGMLAGVFGEVMPYRDPHTAAPALWTLRRDTGCSFEASVVPIDGPAAWRKGWEAAAIALYRQAHGRSPGVNFGRMPPGWRMSSGNNARLVARGKRWRGGPVETLEASHASGIAPAGPLDGDPQAPRWGGHAWSGWLPIQHAVRELDADALGLYRLRDATAPGLLYIGEGRARARMAAHLARSHQREHPQGRILAGAERLECSWVLEPKWLVHQRLELETDLIGAHVLALRCVPPAQFLG